MGNKLPNLFNQTINHFKKYKDCVLVFIRHTNLKSVSETLKGYKDKNITIKIMINLLETLVLVHKL
jgi:3,4-dihydroxy 2-butanone 4-phosphate synthase/GTP cyclohydrolase II